MAMPHGRMRPAETIPADTRARAAAGETLLLDVREVRDEAQQSLPLRGIPAGAPQGLPVHSGNGPAI
ncbi:hypothetical protein [Streptomyces sannanensis]